VSFTLIPGRNRARHKGLTPRQLIQKISRLEREANNTACTIIGLATEIDELKQQRNDLKDSLDAAAIEYSGTLEDVAIAKETNVRLQAENARLRADLANATAITVPQMERDTNAIEDQATAPIDVRTLRQAADAGLLSPIVRISTSGATADPGPRQTSWGRDTDDTLALAKGVAS
jgi:dGTP triphosphohydrolase